MFLASGRSRRINVNHLNGAFHPEHGLVWTDGQHVNLSVLSVNHDDVTAAPPTVLGQFDSVEHTAWSSDTTPCYLCVQQTDSITVWKIDKCSEKLKFEKTNEVEKRAISQGCFWHPSKPLLVILCRDRLLLVDPSKASTHAVPVISSCHRVTAGTWSLDGSKVIIAVGLHLHVYELNDEKELVLSRTIQNFSGPIRTLVSVTPDLIVMALDLPLEQLVSQSQMDMFEAMPLAELRTESGSGDSPRIQAATCNESEVKGHAVMRHSTPDDEGDRNIKTEILHRTGPVDINALIRRRDVNQTSESNTYHQTLDQSNQPPKHKVILESEDENKKNRNDVGDGLPTEELCLGEESKGGSERDSALNGNNLNPACETGLQFQERSHEIVDLSGFKHRPTGWESNKVVFKRTLQEPTTESSQLVLVSIRSNLPNVQDNAKDCVLSAVDLPCVLNPDLLIYQRKNQILVIGSNTQTKCYQVSILNGKSLGGQRLVDLKISKNERCLGLCTLPFCNDILLLTGDSSQGQDVTFLPSSSFSEFQLKLRTLKLNYTTPCVDERCDLESMNDLRHLTLPSGGLLTGTSSSQPNCPRKIEEVTVVSEI
ncbi:uncharacterized protein LOC119729974 [Patiria miniata]|uniref:WD repeat and coiled-coil-containing protein n=1 Tax=Patiria miniata TaxID=46514 RepID=A0A914A4B4_PATMI|nr:uncharacterized protein LOC119729974 [Patiria miniata]